ncbi:hypothetical protein HQ585_01490 [candidate division KSB1 bacterium]|nr:hypothetical protein [candidate division KSB1 bacterium]
MAQKSLRTAEIMTCDSITYKCKIFQVTDSMLITWEKDTQFDINSFLSYVDTLYVPNIQYIIMKPDRKKAFQKVFGYTASVGEGVGLVLASIVQAYFRIAKSTPGLNAGPLSLVHSSIIVGLAIGVPAGLLTGLLAYAAVWDDVYLIEGNLEKYKKIKPTLMKNAVIIRVGQNKASMMDRGKVKTLNTWVTSENLELNPSVIEEQKSIRDTKLHIYVGIGRSYSQAIQDIQEANQESGLGVEINPYVPSLIKVCIALDLKRFIRVGFEMSELNWEMKMMSSNYAQIISTSFDLFISYLPNLSFTTLQNHIECSIGAGFGYNALSYSRNLYYWYDEGYQTIKKSGFGFTLRTDLDIYLTRKLSLNFLTEARIVSTYQFPEFTQYIPDRYETRTLIPHSINLSGFSYSIGLGFHF